MLKALAAAKVSGEIFLASEFRIKDGNNNYSMLNFPVLGFIFHFCLASNPAPYSQPEKRAP